MEGVVQCPVCTLFLHPGMNLDEHLNTHPKDQVIQALTQLTLQRANILSQTSQFVAKSPPAVSYPSPPKHEILIQMPPQQSPEPLPAVAVAAPSSFNKSSISYVRHDTQKNVMIVNSCSTQFIQQRIPNTSPVPPPPPPAPASAPVQIMPRYTSEKYSGPPPPYSTAISASMASNHCTTIARDPVQLVCSSSENSSSSTYEVKAHFTERNDGNFVVEESPQRVLQLSEDENGAFSFEEKIITSPPQVLESQDSFDMKLEADEVVLEEETLQTPSKSTPAGLKVLSNVKIPSGMLAPALQEMLLKKGKRTSKISNRKPTEEDSPEAPVMDLTALEEPSTSQSELKPEEAEEREVTATPTSVIRTVSECVSPKPSTSSTEEPVKASQPKPAPLGRPILNHKPPRKLTLKLKKPAPTTEPAVSVTEPEIQIKQEKTDEKPEEEFPCIVKTEKREEGVDSKPSEDKAGPSGVLYTDLNSASSFLITYVSEGEKIPQKLEEPDPEPEPEEPESTQTEVKVQYGSTSPEMFHEEVIPMSWVQRFSPQYVPFDERSSYMDLDGFSKHSNSATSAQSTSNSYDRAPSTESLNIRTDEKMPAKGEISEQESNGEVDHWNHIYNDGVAQYPTSYDVSQAQECWNLSQNKSELPQFGSFPPLQMEDGNARETSPGTFIPKAEKDIDLDTEKLSDSAVATAASKPKKLRSYRCHDCVKSFSSIKERRLHRAADHPAISNEPSCSGVVALKSEVGVVADLGAAGCSGSAYNQFGGLTSMLSENMTTSLGQIVENFHVMKQDLSSLPPTELPEIKQWVVMPSQLTEETFLAIRTESKKMMMSYRCDTCRDEFKNLKSFNKHFSVHPAECPLCGRGFTRWATFTLHLKRHFNIRDYECRLCNKSFILRQKLVEHMRIHTGNAPIQCNVCFARFRRYSNLAQHRNRHHLNRRPYKKDYVCECGETFVSQAKLNWHRETHDRKPKVCPFCRERFIHANSLTRHIRLSHPDEYSLQCSKFTVQCPFCDQKYLQTSLKAHLETHAKTKNQYACSICNKEFSTKWNLKQHQWTHANRSSKPFQCNVCPNAFVRENDYVTHMNAHKAIRPYTCNHCGCQFVRKSNWMRHTREHEQEKSYTCDVCNKRFHRAYYLTEHRRVHTGERPFACNICGKQSATKTNHNKHIKIHHARDPLTAEG